jgi:EAL domain-containing protein (putative c-di-GMP-specific phosphodiesterase class I)
MASGPGLVYSDLSFPIHRCRNTIGRHNRSSGIIPTIDLGPLDRDRVVSRSHAEIVHKNGQLLLVDVEARNGLFVNGERLKAAAERVLRDGDSVSFGGVALTFRSEVDWPDGLVAEWEGPTNHLFEAPDITVRSSGTLTGQLHEAIERNQFFLHYQPKVLLATGRLEAVECLIRWNHPSGRVLSPDKFLPLAESTGYIRAVTSWVLETGLAQLAEWHAAGLTIQLAVNVSTRDLEDDRFSERVEARLAQSGVDPSDLFLEVTETGVMMDPKRAIGNLKRLKATKVKLSIDDFGIGQSSLASLRQVPADELKIDKSFSLSLDANNLTILKSAIIIGHDLNMRVTAEGVENSATLSVLRQLGCDVGQGYLFGKPIPASEFAGSPLALQYLAGGEDVTCPGKDPFSR